jgi:Protein of unknown function (DUF2950)
MNVRSSREILLIIVCLALYAAGGCASSAEPKKFSSPQAAADSLVSALRDQDTSRLEKIFGPDGGEIISSGDPVADRAAGSRFLAAYDAQHRLQTDADGGSTTLLIGTQDWPFPVPIVKAEDSKYVFDTEAGKDELLNRRIGRNELSTEVVCLAVVDAERDYVRMRPMGGDLPLYARKLVSDPGTKNGLYWPTAAGEPPSPLGLLVAEAAAEGYGGAAAAAARAAGEHPPYHGYRYRLLTAQGAYANGGKTDYMVNGNLIGGFGVVAYPAQYGNSGIMTFITNHDGVVYQRDLGPSTESLAKAMTEFDPGPGWTRSADAAHTTTPADAISGP